MKKVTKKRLLRLAIVSGTVAAISLAGLTGCKSISLTDKEAIDKDKQTVNTVLTANNTTGSTADLASKDDSSGTEKYVNLLGQSKEKLIQFLGEKPVSIDEGGLDFKKAGVRVWFKDYGNGPVVYQVFTQNNDIDFNSAKIGDKIISFKSALGNPISDKNGEAYFKFKDIFLSVNYDTQTENTICVYFLNECNN